MVDNLLLVLNRLLLLLNLLLLLLDGLHHRGDEVGVANGKRALLDCADRQDARAPSKPASAGPALSEEMAVNTRQIPILGFMTGLPL